MIPGVLILVHLQFENALYLIVCLFVALWENDIWLTNTVGPCVWKILLANTVKRKCKSN